MTKIIPPFIFRETFFDIATLLVLSFSPKESELSFKEYLRPSDVIFVFLSNPYNEIVSSGNVLNSTKPV